MAGLPRRTGENPPECMKGTVLRFSSHRFEKFLKCSISRILGFFLPSQIVKSVPLESIRNILVVRQHNELGDMLCAVPLLRALRERFRDARISLVASPVNCDVMLHHPYVDEVILYDKAAFFRSPLRFLEFFRKVRGRKYDLAIVPSTVSMSFTSNAIAYWSGAKYRIGAGSLNGVESISSHLFNLPIHVNWNNKPSFHQTERNLEYGRAIGADTGDHTLVIGLTDQEKHWGEEFLRVPMKGKDLAIGFHPGAGKPANRWPAERFAMVADKLASEFGALIVITEGPKDEEAVDEMVKHLKSFCVLVEEQSIRRVAAIIDRLALYITNDTGVMHVAGATRTSVLSLFGHSDARQWAPPGARHRFLAALDRDMKSLTAEEVFTLAVDMLGAGK
jgi:ADP-heptose:LPS heptosyltransferase